MRRSVNGEPREFCLALNAETGAEVWATLLGDDAAAHEFAAFQHQHFSSGAGEIGGSDQTVVTGTDNDGVLF